MKLTKEERKNITEALRVMKELKITSCYCLVENMKTYLTVALAEKLLKN